MKKKLGRWLTSPACIPSSQNTRRCRLEQRTTFLSPSDLEIWHTWDFYIGTIRMFAQLIRALLFSLSLTLAIFHSSGLSSILTTFKYPPLHLCNYPLTQLQRPDSFLLYLMSLRFIGKPPFILASLYITLVASCLLTAVFENLVPLSGFFSLRSIAEQSNKRRQVKPRDVRPSVGTFVNPLKVELVHPAQFVRPSFFYCKQDISPCD